jgi:hypothetical protein
MGFIYNAPFVALISVGAAMILTTRPRARRGSLAADLARAAQPITRHLFAFFGLPAVPPLPVVGVAAVVGGGSGLVIGALARAATGGTSVVVAITTLLMALVLGLLAAKLYHQRGGKPLQPDHEAA